MQITATEKKRSFCAFGVSYASFRMLCPMADGKERINAFYTRLCENLEAFFEGEAEKHRAKFASAERRARRALPPLCMNFFFTVTYAEEGILSIAHEFVLCEGKRTLFYRKACEVWCTESEILLPPARFFPKNARKAAEKNEFYYDGDAVLVENLFPAAVSQGRRTRLCDHVRETKYRAVGK